MSRRKPRVTDFDEEFVECRSLAHKWDRRGYILYVGKRTPKFPRRHEELVNEIVCERCGSIRMDRYFVLAGRRVGEKIGSHRIYPDGYLVPKGALTRADFVSAMAQQGLSRATTINVEVA